MTRNAIAHRLDRERGHDGLPDPETAERIRQRRRALERSKARLRGRGLSRQAIDRACDLYED